MSLPEEVREKIRQRAKNEQQQALARKGMVKTKYPVITTNRSATVDILTKDGVQNVLIETLPEVGSYGFRNAPKKLTDSALDRFLDLYRQTGHLVLCAKAIGVSSATISNFAQACPSFKEAMREAQQEAKERLLREAYRRALSGYNENVYFKGKKVGVMRKFSDRLLEKLLEGMVPEKFARHARPGSAPGGVQVFIQQYATDKAPREITPDSPEAEDAQYTEENFVDEANPSIQVETPRISDAGVEFS